jgi:hypothetical protein
MYGKPLSNINLPSKFHKRHKSKRCDFTSLNTGTFQLLAELENIVVFHNHKKTVTLPFLSRKAANWAL